MSLPSAVIDAMLESGCTAKQIARAVKAANAEAEARAEHKRAMDAERKRRQRAREKEEMSRDVTRTARDSKDAALARVEDKPLPTGIEPQETQTHEKRETDIAAFRRVCVEGGLDTERIEALIKHRRAKRGAITGHAAALFRRDAEACGMSLIEATDTAISRNWITVKPEYFTNRQRAGPAPPKPNPGLAAVDSLLERMNAVTPSPPQANPPYPRLVAPAGSR